MKYHFEKVLPAEGHSFETEYVIGPVVDCVFHVHPEFELTYVESSFGVRFIGQNIAEFREDDLVLTGPMVPHHYMQFPHDSTSPDWSKLKVIKFRDDFAGRELFELNEFNKIKMMLKDAHQGLSFSAETAKKVRPLIDRIFANEGPIRIISLLEILSILSESKYTLLEASPEEPGINEGDSRLQRVLDYIRSRLNAGKDVTLTNVAKQAGMTTQAFSKYFHQATRRKFIDYVIELKLGRAGSMLVDTDMTILEICYESGFNNLSNFNRHFRNFKDMTPSQYRKKYRKLIL